MVFRPRRRPAALGLSIVTVCRNRRDHLLRSATAVARWPHHAEHLVVDWSSSEPLRRADLPDDPRLQLLRVDGERGWNLCRAYNFAIARASHHLIFKLDADCWPLEPFDLQALLGQGPASVCAFGTGFEGGKGQFLIERGLFEAVGGFNEYLIDYGFDDKDLRARLRMLRGRDPDDIPLNWLQVIPHSDADRAELRRGLLLTPLEQSLALARMRSSRLANRLLAAHYPWSNRAAASQYMESRAQCWQVQRGTVPVPAGDAAEELEHARRMVFWGTFLAIPEIFLGLLPFKLFPPAREGHWPVRWWHRAYWHTGRRLLEVPVALLSCTRGTLQKTLTLLGRG